MNNAELIDGLRKRDPGAARHLNDCFVPSIWRFVFFRVNRDRHLTEDIVAETVLALMSAVNNETTIQSPEAWLRTVALRRIQDHYRAVARVQHLIDRAQPPSVGSDQQDPALQHDQELNRQEVREAMETLPEHYRLALEWKYVEQLSVAVIATRFNTTEKGAEALLFRARRALRSQLQSEHSSSTTSVSIQLTEPEPNNHDSQHRNHRSSQVPPEASAHEAAPILLTQKP